MTARYGAGHTPRGPSADELGFHSGGGGWQGFWVWAGQGQGRESDAKPDTRPPACSPTSPTPIPRDTPAPAVLGAGRKDEEPEERFDGHPHIRRLRGRRRGSPRPNSHFSASWSVPSPSASPLVTSTEGRTHTQITRITRVYGSLPPQPVGAPHRAPSGARRTSGAPPGPPHTLPLPAPYLLHLLTTA